jgi:hypothetical protein
MKNATEDQIRTAMIPIVCVRSRRFDRARARPKRRVELDRYPVQPLTLFFGVQLSG